MTMKNSECSNIRTNIFNWTKNLFLFKNKKKNLM